MRENLLFFGDNLPILQEHIARESVDLVYLDPPFNSSREYSVIFSEPESPESDAQIKAFGDSWRWTTQTEHAFDNLGQVAPPRLVEMVNGFIGFLGRNDLTAYIVMLAGRLVELHRVLKPNGTLFLHCDPTAGHYIKITLDNIFGKDKMINQFTWKRSSAHSDAKQGAKHAGRITDLIFWYAKGETWTHNVQYTPYTEDYIKHFYRYVEAETGRRYRLDNLTGPGGKRKGNPEYEVMGITRFWRYSKENMEKLIAQGRVVQLREGAVPAYKRYLDEMPGVPLQDVWTDINPIQRHSKEWLGYPTQKPIKLLERIINMASNPDDTVLDPFCGCGTTVAAAEKLGRRWIGIDITYMAIAMIENRLKTMFPDCQYKTINVPTTISGARALAGKDKEQFEFWALRLVGARPAEGIQKRGADAGTDGVLFFREPKTKKQARITVQVKGGGVGVKDIRDLRGTVERDKSAMGLFVTLEKPTKPMLTEAAAAGFYKTQVMGHEYSFPRIQILTVENLLNGTERPELPFGVIGGFKAAQRHITRPEELTPNMFDLPETLEEDDEIYDEDSF
jgi:DNA modification methylase